MTSVRARIRIVLGAGALALLLSSQTAGKELACCRAGASLTGFKGEKQDPVGCDEFILGGAPAIDGQYPAVFLDNQMYVTVPEGTTSFVIYLYDAEDVNRNDFDVAVRFGEPIGFEPNPDDPTIGQIIFDAVSENISGYEEYAYFNEDLSPIEPGDYYFLLIAQPGSPGGLVGARACLDDAFAELTAGEPYTKLLEAAFTPATGGSMGIPDFGQQLTIDVPADGVDSMLVRLQMVDSLDLEALLVVRPAEPIFSDSGGLPRGSLFVDAKGGFEELCVDTTGGGTFYIEPFSLVDIATEGTITVLLNGCYQDMALGDAGCAQKLLPGIRYAAGADSNETVDAVQHRIEITQGELDACGGGRLAVTVAETAEPGAESTDLLLYARYGEPIEILAATGRPDPDQAGLLYRNDEPLPASETLVIGSESLTAGTYYVLVGADTVDSDTAPAEYRLCAELMCGAVSFRRGYLNEDDTANIADAVFLLGYLFGGGPAPVCLDSANVNDDDTVNIADAIYLLGFLFSGGPNLSEPFTTCGTDTTGDSLGCTGSTPGC